VITLLLYIVLIVCLGWGAVWLIGYLAPGHPVIIDRLIWVLVIVMVVLLLFRATGLSDVPVPRFR
jgi:hypothetical protein